ncbi:MAG TPA: Mur ligase family protein, partial [Candidatus Levybacteria bacterium]|nr:Mur ligase family protein [Candidatus Levybacteria bacterium]
QYGTLLSRQDTTGISVAGSHGKTTTTAMLATTLKHLGEDPSYVIGTSDVGSLGEAGHLGNGKYFVVESDEYFSDLTYDRVPKFHYQHPYAAIITNIDFDHPDVFDTLEDIYRAFQTFAKNIQTDGILVVLGDNPKYQTVSDEVKEARVVTYGKKDTNTYQAVDIVNTENGIQYTVMYQGEKVGTISLGVIGEHNAINSLSVVALLHTIGKSFDAISAGLKQFTGSKRRIELKGVTEHGVQVIDDYAHHPTEIRATLSALHLAYPEKKVVCIFQPHTFSRTKHLINDFAGAFEEVHTLILLPIFTSAREGAVEVGEQENLYTQILNNTHGVFIKNEQDVVEYCTKNFSSDEFIIVTMGAGDVYKIGEKLI